MSKILDEHLIEKTESPKRGKYFFSLLLLFVIGFIIATFIAWHEVESIIVSGPLMSIVGIILAVLAKRKRDNPSFFIGLIPLSLSVFWFMAIENLNLSPNDCSFILPLSLSIAFLVVLVLGGKVFLEQSD
ncbi:MAG: hypothetical protein ACPGXZ_10395 [Saprospiraceae bacterium]